MELQDAQIQHIHFAQEARVCKTSAEDIPLSAFARVEAVESALRMKDGCCFEKQSC